MPPRAVVKLLALGFLASASAITLHDASAAQTPHSQTFGAEHSRRIDQVFGQDQLRGFVLATAGINQLHRQRAAVQPVQDAAVKAALRRETQAIIQATPSIDYRGYILIARAVQHNYGLRARLRDLVQDLRQEGRIDHASGAGPVP